MQVSFERPELVLPGLALRIGPTSSVTLTTSYLDGAVRLGKGSRGSKFVFLRGGEADAAGENCACSHCLRRMLLACTLAIGEAMHAGMEAVGLSSTTWWGAAVLAAAVTMLAWGVVAAFGADVGRLRLPLAALGCAVLLLARLTGRPKQQMRGDIAAQSA